MASIQDIHALEERIYDAVQEYLDDRTGIAINKRII